MSVPADLKSLAEELDEECARELASAFLEDSNNAIKGIQGAIQARNFDDLKAQVHGLKGCCRTIKAHSAEELCAELENAAVGKDWTKVGSMIPALASKYTELVTYIEGYLGS